jgi:hypothetical protein
LSASVHTEKIISTLPERTFIKFRTDVITDTILFTFFTYRYLYIRT